MSDNICSNSFNLPDIMRGGYLGVMAIALCSFASSAQGTFQSAIGMEGFEKGSALRLLPDGGLIIGGETEVSFGLQESDMLVLRADGNGNVLWTRTYGGSEREVINDIVQTTDLGFMALGEKYQPDRKEGEALTILKTDASGNLMWKKMFDENGNETEGFAMAATPDRHYVITGIVKNLNMVSNAFYNSGGEGQSLYLLKVDESGNKIWSRRFNLSSSPGATTTGVAVTAARDGSYIVTGNISRSGGTEQPNERQAEPAGGNEARNMLLAKVSAGGSLLWAKEYSANRITAGFTVIEKKEGGFLVAGIATVDESNNLDICVLSLAENGSMLWAKTLGGPQFESVSDVAQMPDGGFVISGMTASYGNGFDDALLLKIANNGTLLWAKAIGGKNIENGTRMALTADGIVITGEVSSAPGESFDVLLLKTDLSGNSGCLSTGITLAARDFEPVSNGIEGLTSVEVKPGTVPPNFKRADINNISGQSRQMRAKKLCN